MWMLDLTLMLRDLTSDFKLRLFQLLFFLRPKSTAPAAHIHNRREVKSNRGLSIFCKKNPQTTNGVSESDTVPPEATQWQFSSVVILTDCMPRREKVEVSLWERVNDMLKAFRMEGRPGMCHCKQAEMLGSTVSEWCPE